MKTVHFSLALCLLACSTTSVENENGTNSTIRSKDPFSFLIGEWQRTNDSGAQRTYEFWSDNEDGSLSGLGFTLSGTDTIFKEDIRLFSIEDGWVYEVVGVNEAPTPFLLTAMDGQGFVAENVENEFPERIEYRVENQQLNARVSAGEDVIEFHFVLVRDR